MRPAGRSRRSTARPSTRQWPPTAPPAPAPADSQGALAEERSRSSLTALGIAAAFGLWVDGGYGVGAGIGFGVVAVACGALVLSREPAFARRALRQGPVLVLAAAAALGALSALWTVGSTDAAIRWGSVALGYASLTAAASVVARRRRGVEGLAAVLALLAAAAALAGIAAVVLRETPYAELIDGRWRPGGPLEYPPALALLEASALPLLISRGAAGPSLQARLVPLAGAALAGAVLGLAGSRTADALAAAICLAALWRPRLAGAAGRRGVLAPVAIAAVAGAGCLFAADPGAGTAGGSGGVGRGDSGQPALERFTHGRLDLWGDAIRTGRQRPVFGSGAGSFAVASAAQQRGTPVRFAHDLPLEWWVELGLAGVALALALYWTSARALWRARPPALWLLAPAAAAFLLASLLDWEWQLAGSGAVFALALGGSIGWRAR